MIQKSLQLYNIKCNVKVVCFLLGNSPASEFCMAYKILTSGNYPEEYIQHTVHGESLESRRLKLFMYTAWSYLKSRRI